MSLRDATFPDGRPVGLDGEPPYRASALDRLRGIPVDFVADDPFVADAGGAEHAYLDAAREAWVDYPDWMDFLAKGSPAFALKQTERDLYLWHWRDWLRAKRVLDVGCGVGRFTTAFLDAGATVHGVDADLESLRRCLWHSAGRKGKLDLHWSSAHRLPDGPFDVAVACELLCYVPDAVGALCAIAERLRPGGALLFSVEARWGWAAAEDAPPGAIELALSGDRPVFVPGDRWVRTYEAAELRDDLDGAGLQVAELVGTHYLTDGPLEKMLPDGASLESVLGWEARCRAHPVWGPLNRAWTGVALKR